MAASSIGESTELRRSFGPIGMSSTDCRWRHFRTVFSLIPYRFARLATDPRLPAPPVMIATLPANLFMASPVRRRLGRAVGRDLSSRFRGRLVPIFGEGTATPMLG
jgi:hypothetical protein